MPFARRRRFLLTLAGAVPVAAVPGCGFQLRQPLDLPYRRLALVGFAPRSPMAQAISAALPNDVEVVEDGAAAQASIIALEERSIKTVSTSTAAGQVREFRLRVVLRFRATANAQPLIDETELERVRDMSYTESAALGKEAEQAMLVREMRDDIARQVVRMLATSARWAPRDGDAAAR